MTNTERTEAACEQLVRYGGGVLDGYDHLVEALECLAEINDDIHHMRKADLILAGITHAKMHLDNLAIQIAKDGGV